MIIQNPTSMLEDEIALTPEYLSLEEEEHILNEISKIKIINKKSKGKGRNRILRFGSNKPYPSSMTSDTIPKFLKGLSDKLGVDHVTINEYLPGQSISYHVDNKKSGEVITVISLLGSAVMNLRNVSDKKEIIKLSLPRRSLVSLKGDKRWNWEHEIEELKEKRYSLVFRKSDGK